MAKRNRFSKSADTKNFEKLKLSHRERYGTTGLLANKSITDPRDYERKYYKITTIGPNKGKLVDTGNNNALVTDEYRKNVRKAIASFKAAQSSEFTGRNREIVFGSRTKGKDLKYRNQLRLIKNLEQKRDTPWRASIPKFFKGKTAEGGLLHNYHLNQEIAKQQALANQLKIGTTVDREDKFNQALVEQQVAATKAQVQQTVPEVGATPGVVSAAPVATDTEKVPEEVTPDPETPNKKKLSTKKPQELTPYTRFEKAGRRQAAGKGSVSKNKYLLKKRLRDKQRQAAGR